MDTRYGSIKQLSAREGIVYEGAVNADGKGLKEVVLMDGYPCFLLTPKDLERFHIFCNLWLNNKDCFYDESAWILLDNISRYNLVDLCTSMFVKIKTPRNDIESPKRCLESALGIYYPKGIITIAMKYAFGDDICTVDRYGIERWRIGKSSPAIKLGINEKGCHRRHIYNHSI
jgi:hypothetical protein